MTDKNQTLTCTQQVKASPSEVYFALTNQPVMQTWFSDVVEIDVRENGRFYGWWNKGWSVTGILTKVEENKGISISWHGQGEPAPSQVEIALKKKNGGTLATVKHSEIGTGKKWEKTVKEFNESWPAALVNLQWTLEKGVDKRLFDRPLLGVYIGGLVDEDQAKKLGVPVDKGIWITGTVEGSGAEEVGIQADDAIVKIGETEIVDFNSFAPAIAPFKAEEVVDMTLYRGIEKITKPVKLSRRPFPDVPSTAKELAKTVEKVYQDLDKEMEALFEGVSEEEAAKKPAPEEWSAKEVLAHLLYTDLWSHIALSTAVGGQRGPGFFNDNGQIAAIADTYPTVADLMEAIKRSERITVASLAALQDEFVARKIAYNGLANRFGLQLGLPQHSRTHFTQIQETLKAVQEK